MASKKPNKSMLAFPLVAFLIAIMLSGIASAEVNIYSGAGAAATGVDAQIGIGVADSAAPEKVYVGLYLINLGKFDISTGTFTADFYLSMKCESECSPENFEFMNGRAASVDKMVDEPNEKYYRIQANLNSKVDLKNFPFDKQKMQIILEDKTKTNDQLIYVPDLKESSIDDSIVFPGWNIDGWEAKASEHEYSVYDETYSQYVFTINISKMLFNSFMKTLLPVIFIVIVVLSTFIIDPDKITTRLTIAGTSLVASVMFHVSIANQLPPMGYLTFADKFMMLAYLVLVVSFVINVALLELQEQKKEKLVEKLHHSTEYTMIVLVPILFVLMFLFFL